MRMDVGNNIPYLSEEIISEILSYVCVKSLLVCKSVCKLWYAIINKDEFVENHVTRNSGRLFQVFKRNGETLHTDGIKETYKCLSSINGLVLVETTSSITIRTSNQIHNPSTKQTLDIPSPTNIRGGLIRAKTIYLDSSTGFYNLVFVLTDRMWNEFLFLILLLGRTGTYPHKLSWKFLIMKDMFRLNEHKKYCFTIITTQVGMLYLLRTLNVGLGKPEIICIDLIQNTCTSCIGPESISHKDGLMFQYWQEKPTILSLVGDKLSVWVLEDYKKQKWSDKILISLTYLSEYPRLKKVIPVFFHADGEDLLIYGYPSVCYAYKLESREFCTVEASTGKNIEVAETLVSLKGMRPEKKGCFTT